MWGQGIAGLCQTLIGHFSSCPNYSIKNFPQCMKITSSLSISIFASFYSPPPLSLLIVSCTHSTWNENKSECQWYHICSRKLCQFAKVPLVVSEEKACLCASVTYGELYIHWRGLYTFLDILFSITVALWETRQDLQSRLWGRKSAGNQ